MRFFITIFIIIMYSNCLTIINERGLMEKSYMKNMNNSFNDRCNKEAYIITNNMEIYDCLNINISKCDNLENYTEFNDAKIECIKKCRENFSISLFITYIILIKLVFYLNHNIN